MTDGEESKKESWKRRMRTGEGGEGAGGGDRCGEGKKEALEENSDERRER